MSVLSANFIIDYQIYPFDLMVSINETDDKFRASLHKILPEDMRHEIDKLFPDKTYRARTGHFSGGMTAIHFNFWPQNTAQHGLVSHEIFHAVHFLMERLIMPLHVNNCEAYAYLIQYITEKIYSNIAKITDENKKGKDKKK
jgi:hypothetical protein